MTAYEWPADGSSACSLVKHQRKLGPTARILLAMVMLPYSLILPTPAELLLILPMNLIRPLGVEWEY